MGRPLRYPYFINNLLQSGTVITLFHKQFDSLLQKLLSYMIALSWLWHKNQTTGCIQEQSEELAPPANNPM
jgi:hypothetical protein